MTVDDAAAAVVRFANGALGTIEATRYATGRKNYNRFEINGSLGSVAFDLERMNELELYLASDPPAVRGFRTILVTDPTHPYIKAWWPPGHIIGWEHVHRSIARGDGERHAGVSGFEDGVANQRVMDAIERAAESRAWVTV